MPFTLKKNTLSGNAAGLAIHEDCLRFIEVDEEDNVIRQEYVPLPAGCITNGNIKDFDMLESALSQAHKLIGRLREPLVIGIPPGDTIMRLLSLPNMSIEDVRGTIDLNFDEYFPYPRPEAVFDAIRILTPADVHEREEITVLAVAAKRDLVERLLDTARKAGIPAGAVEPFNFSMLRAIPEAQEGLSIFVSPHTVIAVYNGAGIFFRAANNLAGTQDILNTMQFIETTYRNVRVSRLILFGLNFQLKADSGIEIVNANDDFLAAHGLALRDSMDTQRLDIRPSAYVELERRRYSFNPNRIILWGLLVAFVMLSIGTISFAYMRIHDINLELEDKRVANNDLLNQRTALQRSNAELERQQRHTQEVLDFLRGDMPVLEIMNALEAHFAAGIKFDEADFSRTFMAGITVVIDGKAADEKTILSMTEGLKQSDLFNDVRLPISQKAQTGQVIFKLILRVKEAN
ncbi:MAG: pilus assembly protein PilM [Synergistaceae bacterium]|nr:pilus assembly protein PilM [Synergistaceae bacterium]